MTETYQGASKAAEKKKKKKFAQGQDVKYPISKIVYP